MALIIRVWKLFDRHNIGKKNNFGTSDKDYIQFRHGFGCYSLAGRNGQRQDIVLAPYCKEEHTLIHEVGLKLQSSILTFFKTLHALGMLHEHQRPDRDDHISVDMDALAKIGQFRQFEKACFSVTTLSI